MNLPPWSYSLLSDFANCPKKAYHKYIAKDLPREEKSKEQLAGTAAHEEMDRKIKRGVYGSDHFAKLVIPMINNNATSEHKLGMTDEVTPAEFWGSPWGRGVVDVLILKPPVAVIFDWKTGKVREDPRELHQHALLIKANFPEVEKITGAYVWLKENRLGEVYGLSNTNRVFNGTKATMAEMQACLDRDHWQPTPNPLCGWCPVKKCQFNRS